jgi:hypothetical protein
MAKPIVPDTEISMFVARHEVTPAEFPTAYGEFLKRGSTRLVLWDLTSASAAGVETDDMRDLARRLAAIGKERPDDGKTALVGRTLLTYSVARALGTFLSMEGFRGRIESFSDLDKARAWLTADRDAP